MSLNLRLRLRRRTGDAASRIYVDSFGRAEPYRTEERQSRNASAFICGSQLFTIKPLARIIHE